MGSLPSELKGCDVCSKAWKAAVEMLAVRIHYYHHYCFCYYPFHLFTFYLTPRIASATTFLFLFFCWFETVVCFFPITFLFPLTSFASLLFSFFFFFSKKILVLRNCPFSFGTFEFLSYSIPILFLSYPSRLPSSCASAFPSNAHPLHIFLFFPFPFSFSFSCSPSFRLSRLPIPDPMISPFLSISDLTTRTTHTTHTTHTNLFLSLSLCAYSTSAPKSLEGSTRYRSDNCPK